MTVYKPYTRPYRGDNAKGWMPMTPEEAKVREINAAKTIMRVLSESDMQDLRHTRKAILESPEDLEGIKALAGHLFLRNKELYAKYKTRLNFLPRDNGRTLFQQGVLRACMFLIFGSFDTVTEKARAKRAMEMDQNDL